jgi:hypothetical protein
MDALVCKFRANFVDSDVGDCKVFIGDFYFDGFRDVLGGDGYVD